MKRKLVDLLPQEVKDLLNQKLLANGFSGYSGLVEWLGEQGYEISKSSIHRYGQEFEKHIQSIKVVTEQAKVIADTVGDEENNLSDVLCRLAQQKIFEVLLELGTDTENLSLPQLAKAIADLNRSSVTVKKYRSELKTKVSEKLEFLKEKAIATEQTEDKKLDPKTLEIIRKEIYGIL